MADMASQKFELQMLYKHKSDVSRKAKKIKATCTSQPTILMSSQTNKKHNYNFPRVLIYEYSWRRAHEDNARRQAWSQLFLGDGKYVVLALLRVDGH